MSETKELNDNDKMLKDLFAGWAMQGIIASDKNADVSMETVADEAYKYADAMMSRRKKND